MAQVQAKLSNQTVEYVHGRLVETQSTTTDHICTKTAEVDKELVEMQSVLPGPVSTMYKLVQSGGSLSEAELQQAEWELKNGMRRRALYASRLTE